MQAIYLDMDGTIANLYGVENWEYKLNHDDVTPYQEAQPLHNMQELNAILKEFAALGVTIGVISWLAMHSTKSYNALTRRAKREWLQKYLPCASEIHLVKYGTNKKSCAKIKDALLIDDNMKVREQWKGETLNPLDKNFMKNLKNLLTKQKEYAKAA